MENTEFISLYNEFKQEQHGDFHFDLLSEKIDVGEISGNKIVLKAQSQFSLDNFKARYLASLQRKLLQKTESALLEIILDKPKPQQQQKEQNYKAKALSSSDHEDRKQQEGIQVQEFQFGTASRSADNIDPRLNFSNYIESDHNKWAIVVGKTLSKECNDSYNPFFIWGNVGMGKTHLLYAIGNACKERHRRVLYTSTENFFNNFIQAIRNNKQEYFKKKYRNVDVLLFDDIHDLQNKSKAQDELFYIFNQFQEEGKQLAFTCDRPPHELKDFTERLISRLKSGTNVCIGSPSYEVRLAIIGSKAVELGLQLPMNVAEFLAENIGDSIRDLHGALKKLQTFSSLLGQQVNVGMAERELQEFFSQKRKPVMVRNIQAHVAAYYNLELADVLSKRRNANTALARQVAMFLARELTPLSTKELGEMFDRNHATIIGGDRKIKKLLQNDRKFATELEALKRELQATC